jgi:hypothetical protein
LLCRSNILRSLVHAKTVGFELHWRHVLFVLYLFLSPEESGSRYSLRSQVSSSERIIELRFKLRIAHLLRHSSLRRPFVVRGRHWSCFEWHIDFFLLLERTPFEQSRCPSFESRRQNRFSLRRWLLSLNLRSNWPFS